MDACAVGNVLKSLLLPPKGEAGRANRGLLYMRCLACGAEMRLIQAAPDETTMFAGYEQYTFECSGCRLQVRQLVSHHEIGPFAEERMRLPPGWLKLGTWACRLKSPGHTLYRTFTVGLSNPSALGVIEPSRFLSSG